MVSRTLFLVVVVVEIMIMLNYKNLISDFGPVLQYRLGTQLARLGRQQAYVTSLPHGRLPLRGRRESVRRAQSSQTGRAAAFH